MAIIIIALIYSFIAHAPRSSHAVPPTSISESSDIVTPSATSSLGMSPVVRVVDGDTIVVLLESVTTTVRLIGIDTPETVKPHTPVQCFGPEASAEMKRLLDGQSVRLESDPTQSRLDTYGRTLAYVFLPDGTFVERFLIENGYGREYTYHGSTYRYQSLLRAAQQDAQRAKRGLWSPDTCNGMTATSTLAQ